MCEQPFNGFTEVPKGLGGSCWVHNPGVPNGPASLQNPAQQAAQRQHVSGPAQIHNDRPRQRSDLAKVEPQSNSDLFLRPRIRQTSARCSFPTNTVGTDWERLTGDARSVWAQGAGEQIR